jgi:thiamine-monophosphate kinase
LREAFVRPRPRIGEALWLTDRISLHGLIDLSDGLAGDAGHLAAASGVSIALAEDAVPCHAGLGELSSILVKPGSRPLDEGGEPRVKPGSRPLDEGAASPADPLRLALFGGEDFELCFTVPPKTLDDWVHSFQDSFGIPLTRVGWVREGEGVITVDAVGNERPLDLGGFDHFPREESV